MSLAASDLFCHACGGYAHVFLNTCPTCASLRTSRLEDARRGAALGLSTLAADPWMRDRAERLMRTTALTTSHSLGSVLGGAPELAGEEEPDFAALINDLTGRVRYRAWPAPGASAPIPDVQLHVVADRLRVSSGGGVVIVDAPLALVHAVAGPSARRDRPGTGDPSLGRRRDRGAGEELLVTYATPVSLARLAIGNSAGLFATKARPDHYETLAWWLGVAAAAASERRWTEIGVAGHAAELGLDRSAYAGPPVSPASAGGGPSVGEALRALEELRAANLVDQAEYDAKRREILSRL